MFKTGKAFDPPQSLSFLTLNKKNETSSAQGKKEFNLLDDDELNDVGKLMNLAMFFHLRMMKI